MSPERQRARRRAALWLLAASTVLLATLFLLQRSRGAKPPAPPLVDPLSLIPAGPAFVLTVDVARLRATSLGRTLLGKQLERLTPRTGKAPWDDCEPVLSGQVDRLAFSVPSAEPPANQTPATPTTLGVIAAGRFTKNAALMCVFGSSGSFDATVLTTIGSFATRRDPRTTREVAARDGLLVQSDGPYFRALLDRAEQQHGPRTTEAEATRDKLHAELRRLVGQNAPIVASLVLPHGWLPAALGDPAAEASPLAAIRAAALRLDVTTIVTLAGTLHCESDDSCAHLERFLSTLRTDLAPLNADAATLLSKLTLTRHGPTLDFSGTLTLADLDHLGTLASPDPPPPAPPARAQAASAQAASAQPPQPPSSAIAPASRSH